MDIQMPEMDGLEATKFILHKLNLETRPVIIAMTAFALEGDKEKCIEAGMDDYISKPFMAEEIVEKIIKWMDEKKSIRSEAMPSQETPEALLDLKVIDKLKEITLHSDPSFFKDVINMFIR